MSQPDFDRLRLSDRDLDFLIDTAHPGTKDSYRGRQVIREDEGFRDSFIEDEKVFRRVMADEEAFLRISPTLFFEILLRKTVKDLKEVSFTLEKTNRVKIPVFDTKEVVELLARKSLLQYLADMLSSFTKIESYTVLVPFREGEWRQVRVSDLDILSLMSLCEVVEEEYKLAFYKRVADICLFVLGIFPDYAEREYRYPFSGQLRPQIRGRARISSEEYEEEGRKFYKMAAEHPSSRDLELSDVFWTLHSHFEKAKKPLNFIAEHYLQSKKQWLFV
jgi:hypothetical protein